MALATTLVGGIAYACVTNGITSSAQCGVQITWTAYVNSGDTASWGTATTTKPSGVAAAPTGTNGVKFTTSTFVPGTQSGQTWYITETAIQGNQRGTTYYASQYVNPYSACNPTPSPTKTVNIPVPGPTQTVSIPGPTVTATVPGPTVTATVPGPTVTITTTAKPKPAPTVTVTATPKPKPSPNVNVRKPKASLEGPCGDPFYRANFNNGHSTAGVTFIFRYTSFFDHDTHEIVRHVKAGRVVHSPYIHVLGGTMMTVHSGNGKLLAKHRSVPAGDYGACRA